MWTQRTRTLYDGRAIKVAIDEHATAVSYARVVRHWQTDADFRSFFIDVLADAPFAAFRWETPPVASASVNRPFEFVLLDSPELARTADVHAFAAYFRSDAESGVVEFPNLGADAILVVPCPLGPPSAYSHLAAFLRHASEAQQHALWQRVGEAMARRIGNKPVWLSTAGGGVSWLHVRLDDRPKYYGYSPYQEGK